MGHLGGGSDKDVRSRSTLIDHHVQRGALTDKGSDKDPTLDVVGVYLSLFVGVHCIV